MSIERQSVAVEASQIEMVPAPAKTASLNVSRIFDVGLTAAALSTGVRLARIGAAVSIVSLSAVDARGGSDCLNRFLAFYKWFSALVTPLPLGALAG